MKLLLLVKLLAVLAVVTAEAELVLISGSGIAAIQPEFTRLLSNLLEVELGHLVGDPPGHAAFNVGLGVDDINLLELTASGLHEEEVAYRNTDEVKEGEEEINTPRAPIGEQRGEHDDRKVGDPVGAGGGGSTLGTGTERVDLRRIDPGQRQDSEGEEDDEKEDTNGSTLGVLRVVPNQASEGDDETETLAHETNQIQLATADLLNHEEGWDGGNGVDGCEDTTDNHGDIMVHAKVVLEQHGGVVNGGITTSELLEELAGATAKKTLEFLGLAESEDSLPVCLCSLGGFDVGLHKVEIGQNIVGVRSRILKLSENVAGFRRVSSLHEPRWGIREQESTADYEQTEEDLESDGESPLNSAVLRVVETEVDPVGNEGTNSNHSTFETDEETTVMSTRAFRLPNRDGGGVQTITNACYNTADNELTKTPRIPEGGDGNEDTNNQDGTAHADNATAAEPFTEKHRKQCTKETAKLIAGGDCTTDNVNVSLLFTGRLRRHLQDREGIRILFTIKKTRHHALIVTEQGETHDGGKGNVQAERLASHHSGRPHLDGMSTEPSVCGGRIKRKLGKK